MITVFLGLLLTLAATIPGSARPSIREATGAPVSVGQDTEVTAPEAEEEEIRLPTLWVGDKAPPLAIGTWLHGTPLGMLEHGRVYLIVPCGSSTLLLDDALEPLTAFQEETAEAGLTVLATACGDDDDLEEMQHYVAEHAHQIGFAFAFERDSIIDRTWRQAAERIFPPNYFLVDRDGNLAWIGDDLDLEPTLGLVLAGEHDLEEAAARYRVEYVVEIRSRKHVLALNLAFEDQDWVKVCEAVDRLLAIDPVLLGGHAGAKFLALALGMEKVDEAYAFAKKFVEGEGKNSALGLHSLAWVIVDPEGDLAQKDLDLALRAAQRAVELSEQADADFLDTLARTYYLRGDLERAVQHAQQAAAIDEWYQGRADEWQAEWEKKKGDRG